MHINRSIQMQRKQRVKVIRSNFEKRRERKIPHFPSLHSIFNNNFHSAYISLITSVKYTSLIDKLQGIEMQELFSIFILFIGINLIVALPLAGKNFTYQKFINYFRLSTLSSAGKLRDLWYWLQYGLFSRVAKINNFRCPIHPIWSWCDLSLRNSENVRT